MFKVLLVEDEELVRGFLRANIPWHEVGFEVIGEAEDGQEALDILRERKPDLVITDIIMPIMDGLELLKQSKAEGDESLFLMLTGVNDFEHAREALEYGAWNYLLKLSLTPDSLMRVLEKAKHVLHDRRQKWLTSQLKNYLELYKEIWHQIEAGDSSWSEAKVDLPWIRPCLHIWIELSANASSYSIHEDSTEQQAMIIHSFYQAGITHYLVWSKDVSWTPDQLGLSLKGSYSHEICRSWSELHTSWKTAFLDLHKVWYRGGLLQEQAPGSMCILDFSPALPYLSERTLIRFYEEQKMDAFQESLEKEWNEMARRSTSLLKVKESAVRLYEICTASALVEEQDLHHLERAANHWDLLRELIRLLERNYIAQQEQSGLLTDHPQINQIIQYIHAHYEEPITLEWMANLVSMDKYYLSGLFKKKTGESFIHYLQQLRVEKAKKLLRESNLSLNDIAIKVGYMEDNYLTKMFKRWAGVTPTEYRRKQP
jgi:two-component system response regulator YesN